MFWLFALLSAIAFLILWRVMPETAGDRSHSVALPQLARARMVMLSSFAIELVVYSHSDLGSALAGDPDA